jgi:excisionase family DNA binding protein
MKPKTTLTTGDVARLMNVNVHTVVRWLDAGVIPSYRLPVGRRERRVLRVAFLKFLAEHPEYAWVQAQMESESDAGES